MRFDAVVFHVCFNAVLTFFTPTDSFDIFPPLKRIVRFSKLDCQSNQSVIAVTKAEIHQVRSAHQLFVQIVIHANITDSNGKFVVSKCKDFYVDCVNVASYDISNICSKKSVFFSNVPFISTSKIAITPDQCELGKHTFDNLTISADQFGMFFGFQTETWWERYWKVRFSLHSRDNVHILSGNLQFYFIQYRSRHRSHDV